MAELKTKGKSGEMRRKIDAIYTACILMLLLWTLGDRSVDR